MAVVVRRRERRSGEGKGVETEGGGDVMVMFILVDGGVCGRVGYFTTSPSVLTE